MRVPSVSDGLVTAIAAAAVVRSAAFVRVSPAQFSLSSQRQLLQLAVSSSVSVLLPERQPVSGSGQVLGTAVCRLETPVPRVQYSR